MSFSFTEDTMSGNLDLLAEIALDDEAEAALQEVAYDIEQAAQANAPWQDQTGQARQMLYTEISSEGAVVVLTLAHGVDYGWWLETIQSGAYAIIMPTLEEYGSRVLEAVGGHFSGEEETF